MGQHVYQEQVSVDAPAEVVWAVLCDVERWPTWNESVRSLTLLDAGPLRIGSRARISQPRLPTTTWTVDTLEPGRSFSWTVRSPGMRGVGDHRLQPEGSGCLVTVEIRQTGPLAGLAAVLFGGVTRRYLRMEAQGLKAKAELERS